MNIKAINKLCSIDEVKQLISAGKILVLAGSEAALKKLPAGNWIGGTIPYFMDLKGGTFSKDQVFVTDLTDSLKSYSIKAYTTNTLNDIITDRFDNGFTYVLIPGFSEMHQKYGMGAENTEGLFDAPIVGWITGIDLNDLGKDSPKVVNGEDMTIDDNLAVALHVELEEGKMANLEILNIFEQADGDTIVFEEDGFACKNCLVNGNVKNFAEYLLEKKIDTRFPLVANYSGAMINISFQEVSEDNKEVKFYAPVRKNVEYKLARPVENYISQFTKIVPAGDSSKDIVMSCNCILNYLYSELEGKQTGGITGPITFGEIAYVLVNQTMVYLSIV
ncbi:MAG: hypothetical protein JXA77_09765 [Bacteroidales bacterium]|nr:hypothetical protein [Bacteroidales bacterium]MBN2821431.1 hypothetical protein [Bacteroidales bacterium]